ncbi:membrane protein [Lysinibacillus sphaericus]|uniref:YczE/YyaS/YitT family protein n=1 Tax=Lysinibacillus sphaericus TaxID=1421 RepID=UPI0018CFDF2C|nr:YitT family protein [Lysinibacillus sphaericus]MBG9455438.1 membrane protein [Lysinibacillus sphaericus]MBG9478493.1 membrane protein [Lysinibacillus sphaericus]MBG9594780.1 membrane protein [Lysinibacillus sphaericus]
MKQAFFTRCLFFLTGILLLSLGITLTIKGQIFGVGSWDVLHIGLAKTLGLTIGTWSILIGLAIIAVDIVITKKFPLPGTFIDMFLAGIFIDIFNYLIPDIDGFWMQLLSYVCGLLLLGWGCGMYMVANLGIGPRDSLMLLMVHKLGWSVTRSRTTMEVTVALIGFLLGGPIGVGTVLMAFGLGPIVQFALTYNEKLFLRWTGVKSAVV